VTAVRQQIEAADPPPKVVLLDGESMNDVDATAVITLQEFQQQLAQTGVEIWLARIKTHVLEIMQRGGLEEVILPEHIYPSVQTAVDAYLAQEQAS
jgi:MFS superfamily sulfate permease-like transporter